MSTQDYKVIITQRRAEADIKLRHMMAKHYALGNDANNIDTWWEEREIENELGQKVKYRHLESPPSYCSNYIYHFLPLILNSDITDIRRLLDDEFIGDKVDQDYIKDLLTYAEDLGLATEGAVVIVGGGIATYDAPGPGEHCDFKGIASSNIFRGGKGFNRRAQIVREWCQDKADVKVSMQAQDNILQNRRLEALAHEQKMVNEYQVRDENGRNIDTWSDIREVTDDDGKQRLFFHQDQPKPHSELYIGYFVRTILDHDLEDITPWLNREFNQDSIDKKYVDSLLDRLEKLEMNVEGTMLLNESGELISYPAANPSTSEFIYAKNYSRMVSSHISYGGKKFIRRAQIIRIWCRVGSSTANEIFPKENVPTINNTVIVAPEETPVSKKQPHDPRNADELLEKYLIEFSTAECDELAEAVLLNPPAPTKRKKIVLPYESKQGAKNMIYAIADTLDHPSVGILKDGKKIDFIKALGRRLGFPSNKPERDADALSYKFAADESRKCLDALLKDRTKKESVFQNTQ